MRVTKRTSIALRVLMFCGINQDRRVTKGQIAECCDISENHLAQVINQLSQLGYLDTRRGRLGGLELARPASQIRIGEVIRAIETPVLDGDCFADSDNSCMLRGVCVMRGAFAEAAEAFFARLDKVMLDDLLRDNAGLHRAMTRIPCPA